VDGELTRFTLLIPRLPKVDRLVVTPESTTAIDG
jgi:hypothetical protein